MANQSMANINFGTMTGPHYEPHLTATGDEILLSWTNDGELPNPAPVNVKGVPGADGAPGTPGEKGDKGDKGDPGQDATINGLTTATIAAGANIALSQNGDTITIAASVPTKTSDLDNDSHFQTPSQVRAAIAAQTTGYYRPRGSAALATLPPLTAEYAGDVYNMVEPFVTTADFYEGAGHSFPAGTNVVITDTGGGSYKYDALGGMLDGYATKAEADAINARVDNIAASVPTKTSDLANDSGYQTAAQVEAAVDAKVSGLYKPGGSATLATLPPLAADNAGYVYNMTEAFTTTSDFKEGAGHSYPAGTNVVIADAGGSYKYDALGGMLDGYATEAETDALDARVNNLAGNIQSAFTELDGKVDKVSGKGLSTNDYTTAEKDKLSGIAANATANAPATAAPLTDGSAAVGTSAKYAREDHRHPTDTSRASAADLTALIDYIKTMEIYRTASGNPATFSDAKAANVKDLRVTITPTQSFNGYDRPWAGGNGKNLLPYPYLGFANGSPATSNGVTFSDNGDGSVTINGTASGNAYFAFRSSNEATPFYIPPGDYVNSAEGAATNGRQYIFITLFKGSETVWRDISVSSRDNGAFSVPSDIEYDGASVYICIFGGETFNNVVWKPMLRRKYEADGATPSSAAWEPYENLCPVVGVSSATVTRTGANGANPQSVTVALTDGANPLTVYGGTLDVTAGELTVTHGNIASYNGETVPDGWISSTGQLSTGAQVVYPLASPQTYQLAPAQLATLSSYNAVSADSGSVSVTYRSDPAIALGG